MAVFMKRDRFLLIKLIELPYPTCNSLLTYTGNTISPTWVNYDESKIDISGDLSAIKLGTYTTSFTPKEGFCWQDNTVTPYSVSWGIYTEILSVPSQSGTLMYNGDKQSPTWKNYSSTKLTLGGTTSSTNVGTYEASFTLKSGYIWSDGTKNTKKVSWSIEKATPVLVAEPNPVTMSLSEDTDGVEVTITCTNIKLTLSNKSSTPGIFASETISRTENKTVYLLKPLGVGSSRFTAYRAATNNYSQPSISVQVTVTA